jgi:hypothetical protein
LEKTQTLTTVEETTQNLTYTVKLRAYPRTEQMPTPCVEQDMDVLCSFHGGWYAMQLVRSVCADAGENVATVGAVVAQVSA